MKKMMKMKKLTGVILALAMVFALSVPAFADSEITTAGGNSSVPVTLTTQAAQFSATVPTSMPVSVSSTGDVSVSNELQIINNCNGQIKVSAINVAGINGWSLTEYGTDFSAVETNAKMFGFYIQGKSVPTTGVCDLTNFRPIDGYDSFDLSYDASVANQASALNAVQIANVVFTLTWNT